MSLRCPPLELVWMGVALSLACSPKEAPESAEARAPATDRELVTPVEQPTKVSRVELDETTDQHDPRPIIERAVARKGQAALAGLRTVRTRATSSSEGVMEITLALPDRFLVRYAAPDSAVEAILMDGAGAVRLKQAGRIRTATAEQRARLQAGLAADPVLLLVAAIREDSRLTYAGGAAVDGDKADAVNIETASGFQARVFIDRASHDLRAVEYEVGGERVLSIHSDFRPVDGLMVAHASRVLAGVVDRTVTVQEVTLNPELPPETFQLDSGALR
jgi:hypothetical protein